MAILYKQNNCAGWYRAGAGPAEMVSAIGELGEVVLSVVAGGDGAGHRVADLAVLPRHRNGTARSRRNGLPAPRFPAAFTWPIAGTSTWLSRGGYRGLRRPGCIRLSQRGTQLRARRGTAARKVPKRTLPNVVRALPPCSPRSCDTSCPNSVTRRRPPCKGTRC